MPWLSLPDYARRTGTPESTVRAAIRAGKIRAELEQRAPGDPRTVWRVWLDDPQDQPQIEPQPPAGPRVASESDQPQAATTEPPALTTRLLEMLDADRETIAAQAERIGALEREAGELSGTVDAYRREVAWLKAELKQARRPWWRFWERTPPA